MSITFSCTSCGSTLHVDQAFAGKTTRCSHCQAATVVPQRSGKPIPLASPRSAEPPSSLAAPPLGVVAPLIAHSPHRRNVTPSGDSTYLIWGAIFGVMLVGGGVAAYLALRAPENAVRSGNALPRDKVTPSLSLPADFEFARMTTLTREVDLSSNAFGLEPGSTLSMRIAGEGKEIFLAVGRDTVAGLRGRGLRIRQVTTGSPLSGNFSVRFFWKPESFACYRDGRLLGIWDSTAKKFRTAQPGEAPARLVDDSRTES